MKNIFGFNSKLLGISYKAEERVADQFKYIDNIVLKNEEKVLNSFIKNKVSENSFNTTTGYGYDDIGRDMIDKVYSDIFRTEDALVRHNFVNGTHALSTALFGVLRPGDSMISITGNPYDTLEEVIGIRGDKNNGSLIDFGIKYDQLDLLKDGTVDIENLKIRIKDKNVVYIQRSKGYSDRPSLTIEILEYIIKLIKLENSDIIIIIDNCYGEFAEDREPSEVGADIVVGSLIKNPGGGICDTGGYIVGKKNLIELCSYRLTSVGIGKEVGCTIGQNKNILMGLFLAPNVVGNALKVAIFTSSFYDLLGFKTYPSFNEKRTDIITCIQLGKEEMLIKFCEGIQELSPIDSFLKPEPWDMPGYNYKVIMACGSFTSGSSIEISADAPLKPPYCVWVQGGLTYNTGKFAILNSAKKIYDN